MNNVQPERYVYSQTKESKSKISFFVYALSNLRSTKKFIRSAITKFIPNNQFEVLHRWHTTFCIAEVGIFEKRQPRGNDDLEREY